MLNSSIETHPWEPFIPENAKILIMGTFPPAPNRWSMDFYYPNLTNDFWRIMGLIFQNDKDFLVDMPNRTYHVDLIKKLMKENGIALNDTGHKIRRLKGNASDKFLEIIEPVDLKTLLDQMPNCKAIATTGQKAAEVIAAITNTTVPKMGEKVMWGEIAIWRMPSTSRAYPMKIEDKAAFYKRLIDSFNHKF